MEMSLRSRTPKKAGDYESLMNTPIRSRNSGSDRAISTTPKALRSSASKLSTPTRRGEITPRPGRPCSREGDCSDMEDEDGDLGKGDDDPAPTSPAGSNQENEGGPAQLLNESTPRSHSALSRNRDRMLRSSAYTSESAIDDKEKSVICKIRRTPMSGTTPTPTPLATTGEKRYPLRERDSVKRNVSVTFLEGTSSEDAEDMDSTKDVDTPTRPRRRNASYFSKADFQDFDPEGEEEESGEEDEEHAASNGEEGERSSESDEDEMEMEVEEATPSRRLMGTPNLVKMVLTPEVLQRVEGRSVKRRLVVDSPVALGSQTMSPNPEAYFLADNRIKYKKQPKLQEQVMNDAMKGRRPGRRQRLMIPKPEDNLPELRKSNFSVTAEAMKANVETKDFIAGSTHDEEVERLFDNIKDNEFPHWLGLFRDGFNVMLYGYGSKLGVFKEFEKLVNDRHLVVTINGLFPKLNPRKLLHGLYEHVTSGQKPPTGSNVEAIARDMSALLRQEDHPDIFILINNFDNMALRMPQLLSVVCLLAQVPYIRILASCDTVNAFLGVSQSQALQLRFCWSHCPTFKQYREELKWIPGIYGDERKTVTQKSSLKYVLQSLTGNARKAFALLGTMQLKQMKSHLAKKSKDVYSGVRFQELAKECREKFIAHSDENLRTLLVEFFDHKLIRQTAKGRHIENTLFIELDIETLEEVISEFV